MTIVDSGRLGNLLSQYASLYAYSRILGNATVPLLSNKMYTDIKTKIFPYISIKTYDSDHCSKFFNWIDARIYHRRVNDSVQTYESTSKELDTANRYENKVLFWVNGSLLILSIKNPDIMDVMCFN